MYVEAVGLMKLRQLSESSIDRVDGVRLRVQAVLWSRPALQGLQDFVAFVGAQDGEERRALPQPQCT